MNIITNIKESLATPNHGAMIEDPRSKPEQAMDYIHGLDIRLAGGGSSFEYNTKRPIINVTPYNQRQVGACGAHAATHAAMLNGRIPENAPMIWYSWRTNPGEGMYLNDVLEFAAKAKEFLYSQYPNETYRTEELANTLRGVEPKSLEDYGAEYYVINSPNQLSLDEIAYLVNVKKIPVIYAFYSTVNEWSYEKMVIRDKNCTIGTAKVRHFHCIVPDGAWRDVDGEIYFTILESSPQGGWTIRDMARSFLLERMYMCGYVTLPTKTRKPKLVIPTAISEYESSDEEATRVIQKYLFNKGYLKEAHCTRYYYNVTKKAVLKWQLDNLPLFKKRKVTQAQLMEWDGKYFGKVSLLVAKELQ